MAVLRKPPVEITLTAAVNEIHQACVGNRRQSSTVDAMPTGSPVATPFFFMVGAGASHPSVPLADAVKDECREVARANRPGEAEPSLPADSSAADSYAFWFDRAFPHPIDRQRYLRALIENKPIPPAAFRLAHLLLREHEERAPLTNLVFTPNFDDYLSRSLQLFGRDHVICDHPSTATRIDPNNIDEVQIVHLHGSYWFYDVKNLTSEIEEAAASMRGLLDLVLWTRSPLVVGYSGWEKDVFMTCLRRRIAGHTPRWNVYWFCYRRDNIAKLPDWLRTHEHVRFVVPDEDPGAGAATLDDSPGAAIESTGVTRDSPGTLPAHTVFETLVKRFALEKPKLLRDRVMFFADAMTRVASSGDHFYNFKEIADQLRAIAGDEGRKSLETLAASGTDFSPVRDALITANFREAIQAALQFSPDALDSRERSSLADMLFKAAVRLQNNSPEEIAAYDRVLELLGPSVPEEARDQSTLARLYKALALSGAGSLDLALAAYDEAIAHAGDHPPLESEVLVQAWLSKAVDLGRLGRHAEAIAVNQLVIERFGHDDKADHQLAVARALFNNGNRWRALGDVTQALAAYREVVQRYEGVSDDALSEHVIRASANEAEILHSRGSADNPEPWREAARSYQRVIERCQGRDDRQARKRVALALANMMQLDHALGEHASAARHVQTLRERFADDDVPEVRRAVAHALIGQARYLVEADQPEGARELYMAAMQLDGTGSDATLLQLRAEAEQELNALRGV